MATDVTQVKNRNDIQNPYSKENRAEYKMGKFENLFHKLGFRTGIDQYNEQMDNAAAAWDTQNQSLQYEETYNNAQEQAERQRAAGLNPDLTGGIEAGEAAEMSEPEVPMQSPGTDIEMFMNSMEWAARMASIPLDMATGAASLMSTIGNAVVNIRKGINDIDTQETNLGKELRESANEAYGEFEDLIKKEDLPGQNSWRAKTFGNAGSFIAKMNGLSGRNAKKFAQMYNGMINSRTAKIKEAEKKGKLTRTMATPEITMPDEYKAIQMNMTKHAAKTWENQLWKEEQLSKVLKENEELFKGMNVAEMQRVISEAAKSGNDAAISKYDKIIKRIDSIDRQAEQKQRDTDREYVYSFYGDGKFKFFTITDWQRYREAMERLYGKDPGEISIK